MLNETKKVFDCLTRRARLSKALCGRYDQKIDALKASFNEEEAMRLLVRVFPWLIKGDMFSKDELMSLFSPEYLTHHKIFSEGAHELFDDVAIALEGARLKAMGHSRVCLFDRSSARVYDSSLVMAFDTSEACVYDAMGRFFDRSRGLGYGDSKLEGFDQSRLSGHNFSTLVKNDQSELFVFDQAHRIELS